MTRPARVKTSLFFPLVKIVTALSLLTMTSHAQTVTPEEQPSMPPVPASDAEEAAASAPPTTEPAAAQPVTSPSPPTASSTTLTVNAPPSQSETRGSIFVARVFLGVGFAGYKARRGMGADDNVFGEGAGSFAAGLVLLKRPAGTLGLSAEALVGRSLSGSRAGRAAGDWWGGGLVLNAYFGRLEAALGGYLLHRAPEARDFGLTESRLNGAIGAAFFKDFPLTPNLFLGAGVKVMLLPTETYDGTDGKKHLRLSDGTGTVGISAAWR